MYTIKNIFLIAICLISFEAISQQTTIKDASTVTDNISFFDNTDFTLEYFLVNGEIENLVLNHPTGTGFFPPPNLNFAPYTVTNQLEADELSAFCNGGNAIYEYTDTYLKFISGARTLIGACSTALNQEERFFDIVQATGVDTNPEIFYEITPDQTGLWLWTDVNEKLFFSRITLGVEDLNLDKLIKISPNPTKNTLRIKTTVELSKVSIYTTQGKEVLVKTKNLDKINVSNLSRGIYFIKLKTDQSVLTKKIILQ